MEEIKSGRKEINGRTSREEMDGEGKRWREE